MLIARTAMSAATKDSDLVYKIAFFQRGCLCRTKITLSSLTLFAKTEQHGRQQNKVGQCCYNKCERGEPSQGLRTAKIAKTKDHKTCDQHKRCIDNADTRAVNGLNDGLVRVVVIMRQLLFVVDQKADGHIDGNAKGNTKDQNGRWLEWYAGPTHGARSDDERNNIGDQRADQDAPDPENV